MAEAFLQSMYRFGFISNSWPTDKIRSSDYYQRTWGFTKLDSLFAELTILQLKGGWPFNTSGKPNRAIYDHIPRIIEDSLAQRVVTGELTLEQAHIQLAKYYEQKNNPRRAFAEYKSLIYTVPFFDIFYQPAVKLLLDMKEYNEAIALLYELKRHDDSPFCNKWLGQLLLVYNETETGILYLEKARAALPDDLQVLYNLGRAYLNTGKINQGDEIIGILEAKAMGTPMLESLKKLRHQVHEKPNRMQ